MIREALAVDFAAIASVQVTTWQASYSGIIDHNHLARMSTERAAQAWLRWFMSHPPQQVCQVVVNDQAKVIGYAMGGAAPKLDPESHTNTNRAEIQVLYLLPHTQRLGVGSALLRSMARRLDRMGMRSMQIWTLQANTASQFYQKLGGVQSQRRLTRVGDQVLPEVRFDWSTLKPLLKETELTWP